MRILLCLFLFSFLANILHLLSIFDFALPFFHILFIRVTFQPYLKDFSNDFFLMVCFWAAQINPPMRPLYNAFPLPLLSSYVWFLFVRDIYHKFLPPLPVIQSFLILMVVYNFYQIICYCFRHHRSNVQCDAWHTIQDCFDKLSATFFILLIITLLLSKRHSIC